MAGRSRLDVLLVQRGLVESCEKARAIIMAGSVVVDERPAMKPGTLVAPDAGIRVLAGPQYVSRGGEKLARALEVFALDVHGLTVVDVGPLPADSPTASFSREQRACTLSMSGVAFWTGACARTRGLW